MSIIIIIKIPKKSQTHSCALNLIEQPHQTNLVIIVSLNMSSRLFCLTTHHTWIIHLDSHRNQCRTGRQNVLDYMLAKNVDFKRKRQAPKGRPSIIPVTKCSSLITTQLPSNTISTFNCIQPTMVRLHLVCRLNNIR